MAVCIVTHRKLDQPGGGLTRILGTVNNLHKSYSVRLVCRGNGRSLPTKVHSVPSPLHLFPIVTLIVLFYIKFRYKIIAFHAHEFASAIPCIIVGKLTQTPVIFDAHGPVTLEYIQARKNRALILAVNFFERWTSRNSTVIVTVSKYLESWFKSLGVDKEIFIIPNGVDTNVFRPEEGKADPEKKHLLRDEKIVFFHGTFNFQPNIDAVLCLLKISPEVVRQNPNIRFMIVGGLKPSYPSPPYVVFTGKVDDVVEYINLSDVCVLPYPSDATRGGPKLKLFEYMACAKPVIATEKGAYDIPELKNGENILLCTEKELAQAIIKLTDDNEFSKKLGMNARKLMESKYDWKCISKLYHPIYSSLGVVSRNSSENEEVG